VSTKSAAADEISKQIDYLARAMKAPRIREAAVRLGDQAREGGWSHEEYLAAVLDREVSARDASGARLRIRAAGFGSAKTIEDFVFDHQPGLKRDLIAHLATGAFLAKAENVVLLGPPGTGKTHLAVGLGIKAAQAGQRVLFATATEWVTQLQAAHSFARWGDVFGDQVVAAAMIDRIVHHAEVITLKGSSHRLRNTGIDTLPSARAENTAH